VIRKSIANLVSLSELLKDGGGYYDSDMQSIAIYMDKHLILTGRNAGYGHMTCTMNDFLKAVDLVTHLVKCRGLNKPTRTLSEVPTEPVALPVFPSPHESVLVSTDQKIRAMEVIDLHRRLSHVSYGILYSVSKPAGYTIEEDL